MMDDKDERMRRTKRGGQEDEKDGRMRRNRG
jgi:hypothetical protein